MVLLPHFYLVITFLSTAVYACGKNDVLHYETGEVDAAEYYSFLKPLERGRFCQDLIGDRENYFEVNYGAAGLMSCSHVVPGLQHLKYGSDPNYFALNGEQPLNLVHSIFPLTCKTQTDHDLRTFEGFIVPEEVATIELKPLSNYKAESVTSSSIINSLAIDINSTTEKHGYVKFLPQLRVRLSTVNDSVNYLEYIKYVYEVTLRSDIAPHPSVLDIYNSLPNTLHNNVQLYRNFNSQFGQSFYTSIIFGGVMRMAISQSPNVVQRLSFGEILSIDSGEALMNAVLNLQPDSYTRFTFQTLGGRAFLNLNAWKASVSGSPVPVFGNIMSIPAFLERGNHTTKLKNFERLSKWEYYQNLNRRAVFVLNNKPNLNKLGQFMLRAAQDELDRQCPSKILKDVISIGIESARNTQLENSQITCVADIRVRNNVVTVYQRMFLVEGVCLTLRNDIATCSALIGGNGKCFVFYGQVGCNNDSIKYIVRNSTDMMSYFPIAKSIAICESSLS